MWSKPEIIDWLEFLAPSPAKRLTIVNRLLEHRNKDRMSAEDATICVEAVKLLKAGMGGRTFTPTPARKYLVLPDDRVIQMNLDSLENEDQLEDELCG